MYLPVGHGAHVLLEEPVDLLNSPSGHVLHLMRASIPEATLYVPPGQSTHPSAEERAPRLEPYLPASHEAQPLWSALT